MSPAHPSLSPSRRTAGPAMASAARAIVLALAGLGSALDAQRIQLSAPLERVVAGQVLGQRVSADRSFLVYAADPQASGRVRLVRAALAGPPAVVDLGVEIRTDLAVYRTPVFELAPTGAHVVFLAPGDGQAIELFSVPSDGSAPAVRLNAPLPVGGGLVSFQITPDARRVVFLADQRQEGRHELFVVPLQGGPVVRVSGPLPPNADVIDFKLGPDSRSVFYRANPTAPSAVDLFRGTVVGRQPAVRLSGAHPGGRRVEEYEFAAGVGEVVFRSDIRVDERYELYAVPAQGGTPRTLNQPVTRSGVGQLALTPEGKRVVYSARLQGSNGLSLFSVALQGGAAPRRLDPALGGNVRDFRVDALGRRVVFYLQRGAGELSQLLAAPVDGSAPAQRLDLDDEPGVPPAEDTVQVSPDGSQVVYLEGPLDARRLYASPIDGSVPPLRLAVLVYPDRFAGFDASNRRVVLGLTSVRLDGQGDPLFLGGPEVVSPGLVLGQVEGGLVVYRVVDQTADGHGRTDLYRVPVDGSTPATRVNPSFPPGPTFDDVERLYPAAHAARAAYVTAGGQIFGVALDGSLAAVELTDPMRGPAGPFPVVTPDGSAIVFNQGGALYLAALDGSQAALEIAGAAFPLQVTPDSRRLLYLAAEGADYFLESLPLDGSSPRVRLGGPLGASGRVLATPDGARVVFDARLADGSEALLTVPIDGSSPAVDLGLRFSFVGVRQFSPDGRHLVCAGIKVGDPTPRLLSVPTDGSRAPVSLEDLTDTRLGAVVIERSSQDVVYLVQRGDVQSLARIPVEGGVAPLPLLAPFAGIPLDFLALSPDGQSVVFPFDVEIVAYIGPLVVFDFDVVAVPLDESQQALQLNEARAGPGTVFTNRFGGQQLSLPLFVGPAGHALFPEGERLISAALDGSGARAALTEELGGAVRELRFTPDGRFALFVLPLGAESALHEAATDGSRPLRLVSGVPVAGGNIDSPCGNFCVPVVTVSPDGAFVGYIGDLEADGVYELFASSVGLHANHASGPGEARQR